MNAFVRYLLLITIFVFFAKNAKAQRDPKELVENAKSEIEKNNLDKALDLLLEAEEKLRRTDRHETAGNCFFYSAWVYSKKLQPAWAIKYYQKSAYAFEKINQEAKLADIHYRTGLEYMGMEAFEKAAAYFQESYKFSSGHNNEFVLKLLKQTGDCHFYIGQADSALVYFSLLEEKALECADTAHILTSLSKQVDALKKLKQDDQALEKNKLIFEIYSDKGNYTAMSASMNNIGYNYVYLKKYREALQSFQKSLEYAQNAGLSKNYRADIHVNIGVCQQNTGDSKSAILHLQTALKTREEQMDYAEMAKVENLIALVYFKNNKDLYNASTYSESSIENAEKSGNKEILKDCLDTYSKILQAGTDYEKAMDIYKKYLALRDSMLIEQRLKEQELSRRIFELERTEKELQLTIADEEVKDLAMKQLLLEAEKQQKDIELLRKQKELEESEKERLKQSLKLAEQQARTLLQQQQIKDLETENAIRELELKKQEAQEKERQKEVALLKSEKEKQDLQLEKQAAEKRQSLWAFAFVVTVTLLILYGFIVSNRKNKKLAVQNELIQQKNEELNLQNEEILTQKEYLQVANEEISKQKQEIERKNTEITDSIRYAQRIQAAVLPPEIKSIKQKPAHFVFWKPKDIVSGDFYWIKDIGDKRLIAAADCTGHGVPGAFMSMLGISFLNEIVAHREIQSASEILDELRNLVKTALRQTGKSNEQKDGMDLALCVIDPVGEKIQYAGANNSLVFIRDHQLTTIAADKMPIGIHHREFPFTNHLLDVKKGDMLYLCSDGYQDQFGGPEGRKYLIKNFRALLLQIHHHPLEKQKEMLEEELIRWMSFSDVDGKNFSQLDDILVIGIGI